MFEIKCFYKVNGNIEYGWHKVTKERCERFINHLQKNGASESRIKELVRGVS